MPPFSFAMRNASCTTRLPGLPILSARLAAGADMPRRLAIADIAPWGNICLRFIANIDSIVKCVQLNCLTFETLRSKPRQKGRYLT